MTTVNLSAFAGAGFQFFDNNGVPLAGGLLYSYSAGTTTQLATYTSSSGSVANANPIVLDASGRTTNEIWLIAGSTYKFVLQTSSAVQVGSYDNIPAINDATAFNTFKTTLAGSTGSSLVGYNEGGTNAVTRTVQSKLQEVISVLDFGADPTGSTDSTTFIQSALTAAYNAALAIPTYGATVFFPKGNYLISSTLTIPIYVNLLGETMEGSIISAQFNGDAFQDTLTSTASNLYCTRIEELTILKSKTDGTSNTTGNCFTVRHNAEFCSFRRLRLYGGNYAFALSYDNLAGSYWNTFDQLMCYYQQSANIYVGQGSNATRFNNCEFANAPIGINFLGQSFAININNCSFEGYTTNAVQTSSSQVFISGGYFEQYGTGAVFYTSSVGTIDVIGAYIATDNASGYLGQVDSSSGKIRFRNCMLNNIPTTYYAGTYGQLNIEFSDNNAIGTTSSSLEGYNQSSTFTPIVQNTGGTSQNGSYTKQFGYYTRINNTVNFQIDVTWTGNSTTGNIQIGGLPYTANSNLDYPVANIIASNFTYTNQIVAYVSAGSKIISIYGMASASSLSAQSLTSSGSLLLTGSYNV